MLGSFRSIIRLRYINAIHDVHHQARDYYFKDIAKIQPSDAQSYIAVSQTPWNLKPIYGMLSDSLPVYGYHRLPYIILAGLIGFVCFFMLSYLELGVVVAVVLLFGVNMSVASPGE